MRRVADQIVPGGSVDDAVAALDADPARTHRRARRSSATGCRSSPTGPSPSMADVHFDIPEPIRRIECCLAPTNDGGIYYTGPSEDFSRPGRMWWAVPEGIDTLLHLARGHDRLPRGRARATTCRSARRPTAASCSTAGSG